MGRCSSFAVDHFRTVFFLLLGLRIGGGGDVGVDSQEVGKGFGGPKHSQEADRKNRKNCNGQIYFLFLLLSEEALTLRSIS